jgi:hypothetical protein
MVFVINRNVQYVDFVVNLIINVLLLLLEKLLNVSWLNALELLQLILQTVILLSYLLNNFKQFLYFECFFILNFIKIMRMQFFLELINLNFFFIDDSIFHLYLNGNTFNIFSCSSRINTFSFFRV